MKKKISLIINARKNSSRVKNKLLRKFYKNKSLIEICLDKVNNLKLFEYLYLAAAEDDFFELAKKYNNIKILRRSKKAVKKGVNKQELTFQHYLKVDSDYIFVLNPCLPFISNRTIKMAYNYFQKSNYKSYTAVYKIRDWIFDSNGSALTNKNPKNLTTNQGNFSFKAAHAFHIINVKRYSKEKIHWQFKKNDPHLIEIPLSEAIDIDTPSDFLYAQAVYKKKIK